MRITTSQEWIKYYEREQRKLGKAHRALQAAEKPLRLLWYAPGSIGTTSGGSSYNSSWQYARMLDGIRTAMRAIEADQFRTEQLIREHEDALAVPAEIVSRSTQAIRGVSEEAQAGVALAAQHATDHA